MTIKNTYTNGVKEVTEVRARWIGHQLHAEVNLTVPPDLSVADAHEISQLAQHEILDQLPYFSNAIIHNIFNLYSALR